ncbi:MAG TPA: ArsR family transcriptional regulator [Bacteroidia bacterium]|nr:ArsR family transcriptional regulator [Bacteroidia bacterium]
MVTLERKVRMNLKNKIISLLEQNKYTYKELAEHLKISEAELDHVLETKTLEVRTLELISKELRIPLYSFFRDPAEMEEYLSLDKQRYYDVNIWSDQEVKYKSEITKLKEELQKLTAETKNKDLLIEALEGELKKGWTK